MILEVPSPHIATPLRGSDWFPLLWGIITPMLVIIEPRGSWLSLLAATLRAAPALKFSQDFYHMACHH